MRGFTIKLFSPLNSSSFSADKTIYITEFKNGKRSFRVLDGIKEIAYIYIRSTYMSIEDFMEKYFPNKDYNHYRKEQFNW